MEVYFTQAFLIILVGVPAVVVWLYLFLKYFSKEAEDVTEAKEREWDWYKNYLTAEEIRKNLEWEKEQIGGKKNGR